MRGDRSAARRLGVGPTGVHAIDDAPRRVLRATVGTSSVMAFLLALTCAAIGTVIRDPSLAAAGVVGLVAAVAGVVVARLSESWPASTLASRVAVILLLTIAADVAVEPSLGTALAIAALIPAVLAMPFVSRAVVVRLMLLGAATGTYAAFASASWSRASPFATPFDLILPTTALITTYAVFHLYLWNASGRLSDTTNDLGAANALSREVAQTLDPQLVGRIIARHIAISAGADDCALSTWDRENDRLVTFAYYPPERQEALEATYDLAHFPATSRVLREGVVLRVDVDEPSSDADEVAYLGMIGHKSMVIVPLVVRGEAIGTIELTADRKRAFSDRGIELASMLAREAAISLENARLYDQIHDQAFRDGLTGLANRVLFHDRVTHALERSRGRSPHHAAVLFLDIDHFKLVNDRFGHPRGDEVLRQIGERVRSVIRPGDTAARLGGDEFAILLEEIDGTEMASAVADRLAASLGTPIEIGDGSLRVGASIGIAVAGTGGDSADDLLRNADIAMYAAKAAGRGRIELFRPEHLERAAARSELGARLRGATERGELHLVYQPIVELGSGNHETVGVEALVRWQAPSHPLRMPADFIALAEETGEIVPLGRWVIEEACRQGRVWQVSHDLPDLRVNVNLSPRQFIDPDLHRVVAGALGRSGLAPHCLTLEFTESTLMQRTEETLERVRGLRNLGVRLSIDDFGTGYSSLGYLQAFAVDELKIDRSFVSESPAVGNPMVLSRAIVELGRALGIEMVVEGVESERQAAWFASLGCQYAQGHFYAWPMAVEELDEWLATRGGSGRSHAADGAERRRRNLRVVRPPTSAAS